MLNRVILFIIFSIFWITSTHSIAQNSFNEKNTVVALREVGHKILLASNDSTSRILAIEKENERYKIQFESNFYFLPDSLAYIIKSTSNKYSLNPDYIVEVEKCNPSQTIYSYKQTESSIDEDLACKLRMQPKDCYTIFITYIETTDLTADLLDNTVKEKSNYLTEFILGLLLFFILLFLYFYKSNPPKKVNENVINISAYKFDHVKMTLSYNSHLVELSSKESELLHLLNSNINEVIERDKILELVWGDEGDYVGRTLDVFISKLRKKLAKDETIKIANIRGVGYKLIV